MPENHPLVSIVIPSWQKGRFLGKALDSIISQTYHKIEIIVLDNHSTDETQDVLHNYRDKIDKISVEKDYGQTDALRRGFEICRGEILAWLNADDMLMPNTVKHVVETFCLESRPQIIYGHCALVSEKGQFLHYFNSTQPFSLMALLNRPNIIAQPSTFFLRQCYHQVGGLDSHLSFVMDWDLWCKFGKAGYRFHFLDEVLACLRIYKETKSLSGGRARFMEILHVNGRHKTTFLPLGSIGYFYVDHLRPRAGIIAPWLRWLRQRFLGDDFWTGAIVKGITSNGWVVSPNFRIQFPLYSKISCAKLYLNCQAQLKDQISIESRFNSISGEMKKVSAQTQILIQWDFSPPSVFNGSRRGDKFQRFIEYPWKSDCTI